MSDEDVAATLARMKGWIGDKATYKRVIQEGELSFHAKAPHEFEVCILADKANDANGTRICIFEYDDPSDEAQYVRRISRWSDRHEAAARFVTLIEGILCPDAASVVASSDSEEEEDSNFDDEDDCADDVSLSDVSDSVSEEASDASDSASDPDPIESPERCVAKE